MNRRIAAVRGLFEYAVRAAVRQRNPVPAAQRTTRPLINSGVRITNLTFQVRYDSLQGVDGFRPRGSS
jgi:hypothetical protein